MDCEGPRNPGMTSQYNQVQVVVTLHKPPDVSVTCCTHSSLYPSCHVILIGSNTGSYERAVFISKKSYDRANELFQKTDQHTSPCHSLTDQGDLPRNLRPRQDDLRFGLLVEPRGRGPAPNSLISVLIGHVLRRREGRERERERERERKRERER